MSTWDAIKRQLRSVIEWKDMEEDALFYRWSENGDEIKNASKLIVGPGQGCIFVYEGRVVSVIEEEGMTSLLSDNIPFWTTIKKFMQAFESEHKVGIYFFRRTHILNQKWGTRSLIKYDDPKYNFPVGLMAYGNYSFAIEDPRLFFTSVVGQKEYYGVSEFKEVMGARILEPFADFMATHGYSYAEVDKNLEEIAHAMKTKLNETFVALGFFLSDFRIEGSDFDLDTKERIKKIADITAYAHGAKIADVSFSELQRLEAMKDAANNQVGAAGLMMGMGVAGGLANSLVPESAPKPASAKERLVQLKELFDEGLINEAEYEAKKKTVLAEL